MEKQKNDAPLPVAKTEIQKDEDDALAYALDHTNARGNSDDVDIAYAAFLAGRRTAR